MDSKDDNQLRNELKVQALLEKVSNLTTRYENEVADLRVELTILSKQLEEANKKLEDVQNQEQAKKQVPDK
jgi:hypothetical protein